MANYTNHPLSTATIANTGSGYSIGARTTSSNLWPGAVLSQNVTVSLDDWLNTNPNPNVKKYEILEIGEDLLALSTTWKRLRDEHKNGGPYHGLCSLIDNELFGKVTDKDREQANAIRDYYSKKIMVWKLKGRNLTKFREDMNTFIHADGNVFKKDMLPLAYRLPEFYEYDVQFDALVSAHNKSIVDNTPMLVVTKKLELQKTFSVGKKFTKRKEFWFSDEQTNLVVLSVSQDNPLLPLLELHTSLPINVEGKFKTHNRDGVEYLVVEKYKFK